MRFYLEKQLPQEVVFIIHSKAHDFQKEGIRKIKADDIKSYLYDVKWKDRKSIEYCDMIDDIMSLQFSDLFDFLRTKVIIDAQNKELSDFKELIFK